LPTCSLRVGDGDTKAVFRRLLEQALQELIDAELTARSAPSGTSAPTRAPTSATASATGCCRRRPVMWSCGSPRSGRVVLPVAARAAPAGRQGAVGVIMTAYTRHVDPEGR
jgi:hypothetical protein